MNSEVGQVNLGMAKYALTCKPDCNHLLRCLPHLPSCSRLPELCAMERQLLAALSFELSGPTALRFLRLYLLQVRAAAVVWCPSECWASTAWAAP